MSGQYFDSAPASADRRREVTVRVWGTERRYVTSSGVFSADGLDKATAILLNNAVAPEHPATVLDLGCGWGAIACTLAGEGLATWAVDVNERALELTRANAERFGFDVTACLPQDVPADVRFDEIWSNPPIRIGKEALHDLLLAWLPRLTPDGRALLVVGKNLGADSLRTWLEDQGWPTRRLATDKGFRVLEVRGLAP